MKKNIPVALASLVFFAGASSLYGANIIFRTHHKHEVESLINEPVSSFPIVSKNIDGLQFPPHLHSTEKSRAVIKKIDSNVLVEEVIIRDTFERAPRHYRKRVKMINKAEETGWDVAELIAYREPSFGYMYPNQNLLPGPWNDLRMLAESDITALREKFKKAHNEGTLQKESYKIYQLIYAWKNIGDPEKTFMLEHFDGAYIELNTRGGNWVQDGTPDIYDGDYKPVKSTEIKDFGDPGTKDTAQMAKWCMDHNFRFGITMGSNVKDIWFKDMMSDLFSQMRKLGVDPGDERITYVIHHNRDVDDKLMPYFPETEENTITNLSLFMIENVGQLRKAE